MGEADYEDGWIIVGTSYKDDETAEENDVSNDMTFPGFCPAMYLTPILRMPSLLKALRTASG